MKGKRTLQSIIPEQGKFFTKKDYESGRRLENASELESHICEKIIKGQTLPDKVKFSALCYGKNNKSLNYGNIYLSGDVNGYFLIIYYDLRMINIKIKN